MTAAIKTAWNVAKQQGFGVITFLPGTIYAISSFDPKSPLNLPIQNGNGSIGTSVTPTQLYFQGGSNIVFDFQGCRLRSTVKGGGVGLLFDNCQSIRLVGPDIAGTQVMTTGVVMLGTIAGGSDYRNGTYTNVLLSGGSGHGAAATVVVAGGAVTGVTITYVGGGYAVNDVLSATAASIGGTGSGFSVPVTDVTGAGNVVGTAAIAAIGVTSLSGQSTGITVIDLSANACYTGVYVTDNPNNRVTSHISLLGRTRIVNGLYGVALHNGGDHSVIENLYTYRIARPFFTYGVRNVVINCLSEQILYGFGAYIEAYSRNCGNLHVTYKNINAIGANTAKLSFAVQCDPLVVNPPPTVQNVYVDYEEQDDVGGGYTIQFNYFAGTGGTVQQSRSSNPLFNNIVLRGFCNGSLLTTVSLAAAAQCLIDFDYLRFARPDAAHDLNNHTGFVQLRKLT
jgi:hypothetical protein